MRAVRRLLVDARPDVLARREPRYEASAQVWMRAERGELKAFTSAIGYYNIY